MSLKVLHITASTAGGAGIAVMRIHHALLRLGINSKVLVMENSLSEPEIFTIRQSNKNRIHVPNIPIVRRYIRKLRTSGFLLTSLEKIEWEQQQKEKKYGVYFSLPVSSYEIEHHPLIDWADIIHIHWIQNFVNFQSFFKSVKKPIVWTMHDQNPLYGGFHHERIREQYLSKYKELEDRCIKIKESGINQVENLSIVAISSQMHEMLSIHPLYNKYKIYDIPNCVNSEQFILLNKESIRKKIGWDKESKYFLFVNKNLNDTEKGLVELIDALNEVALPNYKLVCVGNGDVPYTNKFDIVRIPATDDFNKLCEYYNAADFLLMPSFQESFGNTVIESLYCGTPVLMNKVGVAQDIINNKTGMIANFSMESWVESLICMTKKTYDRLIIRQIATEKFSPNVIGEKYIKLYKDLI